MRLLIDRFCKPRFNRSTICYVVLVQIIIILSLEIGTSVNKFFMSALMTGIYCRGFWLVRISKHISTLSLPKSVYYVVSNF